MTTDTEILRLRSEIETVSIQLTKLLLERKKMADSIIQRKKDINVEVIDLTRETELIQILTKNLSESDAKYVKQIFEAIFKFTRG